MGLDVVVMLMAVEDEFDIEIGETEAQSLKDVGAMWDYIVRKVEPSCDPERRGWCRTQQAFYLTRRVLKRRRVLDLTRVRDAEKLRPRDEVKGRLTPWQWVHLGTRLASRTGEDVLPDAKRNLLRWPTALPDGPRTFGDVARALADCGRPVRGAAPPLGPDLQMATPSGKPFDEAAFREEVWGRLQRLVSRELGVPLDKVTPEARWSEDLGAG